MTAQDWIPLHAKNILLTGKPGCGKTTVFLQLVELLSGLRIAGFYTQEIRRAGRRMGIQAVGLSSGLRYTMASIQWKSPVRVGRYGVEPERLTPLVAAELVHSR